MNIAQLIAQDLSIQIWQVEATLALLAEGATVPFIARYRKERTDELNEVQLRQIAERNEYLGELAARKKAVLEEITKQNALTPQLKANIDECLSKTELEDLYLPYKPKRRTRATIAKEKGLEPLSIEISRLNASAQTNVQANGQTNAQTVDLTALAQQYLNAEVPTPDDALGGAADILAETMAEQAPLRAYLRSLFLRKGQFTSKIKSDYPEGTTKYEMYRSYQAAVSKIAPHNLLALLRGDKEGVLRLSLTFDEAEALEHLLSDQLRSRDRALRQFYTAMVKDGFNRLMKTSLINEVIAEKKAWADGESIQTFAENLRNLMLAAPAGMKPTLGVDPGFRTGCKVAAISETGQFLAYEAIYPHSGQGKRIDAAKVLTRLIESHNIELIAIGNGTASRETDEFVGEVISALAHSPISVSSQVSAATKVTVPTKVTKVIVNESGASIYSASEVALAEFPNLDVTVRGAISIGRRLQDPLAELVKLDPKSIGVGQYQHDVDQKQLKQKLDETVESCVNYVGVDLNTASRELLRYVSGISSAVANNIVNFRDQTGRFSDRKTLLKVAKLGPKAYEQAAGFLRIRGGDNPLDNTAVHPESYSIVKAMAQDLQVPLKEIPQAADRLKQLELKKYVTDKVGEPTLRDILTELEKPGRDPRAQFSYATFAQGINNISDLKEGMTLEGIVTNVADFGAFVDIGVHQDGLVHVSQMADRFIKDPKEVVQVGQVIQVRVTEVQEKLKRIGLSMKVESAAASASTSNASVSRNSPTSQLPSNPPIQPPTHKPIPKRTASPQLFSKSTDKSTDRSTNQSTADSSTDSNKPLFDPEDLKRRFNRRKP
jgi:protein Tex